MYNIVLYILKSSSYSLWEKKPSYLGYLFIYLFIFKVDSRRGRDKFQDKDIRHHKKSHYY